MDLNHILPISVNAFFEVSDWIPTAAGRETLARQGIRFYVYSWFDDQEFAGLFTGPEADSDTDPPEVSLPPEELILLRPYTGDHRTFALLNAASPEQPIRLLDAPEGEPVLWTYRGDQAEVLETRGNQALIRIARGQGWVPTDCLIIVEQEAP